MARTRKRTLSEIEGNNDENNTIFSKTSSQQQHVTQTLGTQQQNNQSSSGNSFSSNTQQQAFGVPNTVSTQKFFQDIWSVYEQEIHDTIIKLGSTEFKILKAFFISHSEVFKSMFTLNFKERKTCIVEIKDVSEQAMKNLIKWMYTCRIENQDSIEELFEVADKYQVNLLKTHCVELLISSLNNSNVFCRLILAVAHNNSQLKDAALKYIDKMPKNEAMVYLTSSEWIELAQKKPVFANEVNKLICDKLKK